MNFRTQIASADVSIYDLSLPKLARLESGRDYEIEPLPFIVSWDFQMETRDWGVKDMSWRVTNVEGQFEVVYFDEHGDETEREMVDFEFEAFRDKTLLDLELHQSMSRTRSRSPTRT